MNQVFFDEFGLKTPKIHLEVGSGPHGEQTGKIMERFEKVCFDERPSMVFTVGDVNSTMAVALVAAKLHIPIAHQEAGMRSGDKKMPEEINRIVTDHISDFLFPISRQDQSNLYGEGIIRNVWLVGDPMIDNLLYYTDKIPEREVNDKHFLVELHRPANVDDPKNLTEIMIALSQLSEKFHVVFTIHPRTRKKIYEFGLTQYLDMIDHCEPMGYFDFHEMMKYAGCVITDSDGIQQETSILNVSCIAIRDTSNIQYTIDYGTTDLCEPDRQQLFHMAVAKFHTKEENVFPDDIKALNDGNASERIAEVIKNWDGRI
jgi:UDP-N-acetylglucosamine 2-epimerase (non-hydrolysing)